MGEVEVVCEEHALLHQSGNPWVCAGAVGVLQVPDVVHAFTAFFFEGVQLPDAVGEEEVFLFRLFEFPLGSGKLCRVSGNGFRSLSFRFFRCRGGGSDAPGGVIDDGLSFPVDVPHSVDEVFEAGGAGAVVLVLVAEGL